MTDEAEKQGWRTSAHVFAVFAMLAAIGAAYDLFGPARYDEFGGQVNGIWAGRAVLAVVIAAVLLGAYRGLTRERPVNVTAAAPPPDSLDQLQKLGQLRESGVLTDEEFEAKKAEILRGS